MSCCSWSSNAARAGLAATLGLVAAAQVSLAAQVDANGIQSFDLDVSYKSGIAFGSMHRPRKGTDPPGDFDFSGVPLAFVVNQESSPYFSFYAGIQILIDVGNDVVSRKGADAGGCVHLLGGSRRAIVEKSPPFVLLSYNNYNLSLCDRMSYFLFSVSNKEDIEQNVQGAVLENLVGLNFRYDLTKETALGVEGYATVKAIPASVERVTSNSTEALLYIRTFI